jgi:hypothetical protein
MKMKFMVRFDDVFLSQYPQLYESLDEEHFCEVHSCVSSGSRRAAVTPKKVSAATLSFESDRTTVQFLTLQAKLIDYAYDVNQL